MSEAGELYALHQIPPLKLYGKVNPSMTRVAVLAGKAEEPVLDTAEQAEVWLDQEGSQCCTGQWQ